MILKALRKINCTDLGSVQSLGINCLKHTLNLISCNTSRLGFGAKTSQCGFFD